MFHFLKPKTPCLDIGLLMGGDMHAHWLPNIDDGAATMQETLDMAQRYVDMGFTRLCATPHIYPELHPNTPETITAAFMPVAREVGVHYPQLQLSCAAEYFIDADFDALVAQNALMCFDTDKVLVEQGFFSETPHLKKSLFAMQIKGYQPVLAHPERYAYYYTFEQRIRFFRDADIKLQLNLLSLAGKYRKVVAQIAERRLLAGYYDYLGTDAHSSADLDILARMHISSKVRAKLETLQTA